MAKIDFRLKHNVFQICLDSRVVILVSHRSFPISLEMFSEHLSEVFLVSHKRFYKLAKYPSRPKIHNKTFQVSCMLNVDYSCCF